MAGKIDFLHKKPGKSQRTWFQPLYVDTDGFYAVFEEDRK
jgi:DNA polymerase elongation subunit (family B)